MTAHDVFIIAIPNVDAATTTLHKILQCRINSSSFLIQYHRGIRLRIIRFLLQPSLPFHPLLSSSIFIGFLPFSLVQPYCSSIDSQPPPSSSSSSYRILLLIIHTLHRRRCHHRFIELYKSISLTLSRLPITNNFHTLNTFSYGFYRCIPMSRE